MQSRYPEPPGQYTLATDLHDLVDTVKASFGNGVTPRGIGTKRPPRFRTKVKGTADPCTVEYLVLPRTGYSLRDLAADRPALAAVNRNLARRVDTSSGRAPAACLGYDADTGEPAGRLCFGSLSVRYLMRDRVRSGLVDLFFDKFCFHETAFETIARLGKADLSAYAAAWVDDVEAVVDEELARGGCDRLTVERRIRTVDAFLRGVHRRHQMPRRW